MNTLTLQLSDDALEKIMAMLANMPKEVVLADIQKNEIVSTSKVKDVNKTSWADFASSLKEPFAKPTHEAKLN